MAKEGYTINPVYSGGYSSLKPGYNKGSSYDSMIATGSLGITTDPRTANVLKEVSDKLSMGVKQIEVEGVSPDVFDAMPKQHLQEVHRLSKLTGVDVSLHGPVIDVAGFTRQGYSKAERELAERKVLNTLLRAKDLNPEGHIPVNFHAAEGIPSSQFLPPSERKKNPEAGNYKTLLIVNKESGRIVPLEAETKYYPSMMEPKPGVKKREEGYLKEEVREIPLEKGKYETPEERMRVLNDSEWDNQLNQVFFNQERATEILGKNQVQIQHIMDDIKKIAADNGGKIPQGVLSPTQMHAYNAYVSAKNYLQDMHQQANGLFSKAYEFGTQQQKDALKDLSEEFKRQLPDNSDPWKESQAMQFLINELKKSEYTPKMWEPLEDFAADKTALTFGNAAFDAYKKLKGKNVPTLVIENPPAGFALSTGEDLKKVVEKSREQFVKKAVEGGMTEDHAKEEAKKLIGATWDVGHINMLRKFGYSEKEIVEESKKVAPYVKHIHLSDNFGFEHTELPMGMGNVPLKEIMEKLGEKGYEAKKIIEAGHWFQHFRTPPFQEVLEATGSPIYGMKMAPYWDQAAGLYQSYSEGMQGQWLPQINYETFGGSFSRLPPELGGSRQGAQGSRMSGRPMQ